MPAERRRVLALLALGATAGLGLAVADLLAGGRGGGALPPDAVASVNGEVVRAEEFERAVAALAADTRAPVGETEKRRVLDRLVEEELLVQRALELGLARRDRRVRGDLVSAVMELAMAGAAPSEPGPAEVEAFYREHGDYFAQPGRMRVRHVLVRGADSAARLRAEDAVRRLRAGEDFAAVRDALGDAEIAPLPDTLLPPVKIREYLGPTATRTALDLPAGAVSDPVRSAAGLHVLQVVEREAGRVPPLAEIEDVVRAELLRRADDRALRAYLDDLRARATVRVAGTLP